MAVSFWLYYLLATLLCLVNMASVAGNLLLLPGNWMLVCVTVLFAALVRGPDERSVSWVMVATVVGLAVLGEVAEFAAGAAGAARVGGSRRGIALSMVGAIAGSVVGLAVGAPIPVFGSIVAALAGGALGAFGGAYVGEQWKGRSHDESLLVSEGAMLGRLGGTAVKLVAGVVMVVLVAWDALF